MNNQKRDISKYHRTLKLTTHFGTEDQAEIPRFLPTSYWEPEDKETPRETKTTDPGKYNIDHKDTGPTEGRTKPHQSPGKRQRGL